MNLTVWRAGVELWGWGYSEEFCRAAMHKDPSLMVVVEISAEAAVGSTHQSRNSGGNSMVGQLPRISPNDFTI